MAARRPAGDPHAARTHAEAVQRARQYQEVLSLLGQTREDYTFIVERLNAQVRDAEQRTTAGNPPLGRLRKGQTRPLPGQRILPGPSWYTEVRSWRGRFKYQLTEAVKWIDIAAGSTDIRTDPATVAANATQCLDVAHNCLKRARTILANPPYWTQP